MCGASARTDATQCAHCGARLATVACPSCFGMMFVGAKFCSRCGARADRVELPESITQACPRCRVPMKAVAIGGTNLKECPRCEGIWADAAALEQVYADRERQAAVLGMPSSLDGKEPGTVETQIRYGPCPVCKKFMNRVNFAHCSHVVVDVCLQHGTWFDKDELRQIVEFIRKGGLEAARARQISDLQKERQRLKSERIANAWTSDTSDRTANYSDWAIGISGAAQVLKALLRK